MDWSSFIGVQGTQFGATATLGAGLVALIVLISIWSLIWKGLALWKSSRKNSMVWFIVLLLVNTIGILEILYIFWFSKLGSKKLPEQAKKKKR